MEGLNCKRINRISYRELRYIHNTPVDLIQKSNGGEKFPGILDCNFIDERLSRVFYATKEGKILDEKVVQIGDILIFERSQRGGKPKSYSVVIV